MSEAVPRGPVPSWGLIPPMSLSGAGRDGSALRLRISSVGKTLKPFQVFTRLRGATLVAE